KNQHGERVIDFRAHNLHVLSYSVPVRRTLSGVRSSGSPPIILRMVARTRSCRCRTSAGVLSAEIAARRSLSCSLAMPTKKPRIMSPAGAAACGKAGSAQSKMINRQVGRTPGPRLTPASASWFDRKRPDQGVRRGPGDRPT
ncbi:MAG: DUF2172 domain-containing protein, partial [bacterium]|nr:DUF2172 domain-containing protein [bacterium]